MRTALLFLLLLVVCAAFAACGAADPALPDAALTTPDLPTPRTPQEAIAQLDALPTPAGVDPALFATLKQALRTMLAQADPAKFGSTPPQGVLNAIADLTSGVDDSGNPSVQWNYRNIGDYDMNSEVNVSDITRIGLYFSKSRFSEDWKSAARFADGDENGEINVSDITPIGAHFLSKIAGYHVEGAATPEGPFTPLGDVAFEDGTPLLTGIRMYHFLPAVQYEFYRVVPFDLDDNPGTPSKPSQEFLISENTRIVGGAGGPTFVSRDGNDLTLQLPPGEPTPIAPGDVVVGAEDGGYLMRVLEVQRTGDELDLVTEPGILADVFLQGGLAEALDDISQVPPEVYTLDLSGQVLHSETALQATITDGSVAFLPQADVAVNYNQYGGVTYLRGLVLGGPLDLKMTVEVIGGGWSGPFPPTPAATPFFEHKMTGFTFDFTAYQNGVPVTMALQYDLYVGIRGDGTLNGMHVAQVDSQYLNIKMGGIYNSGGLEEFNEYNTRQLTVPEPGVSQYSSDLEFTAYVRAEIHIRLYGNPLPGNTEDLALTLQPQLTLTSTRTNDPAPGLNYALYGSMDTSYMMELHHIGLETAQQNYFTGVLDLIHQGYVEDLVPPA